DICRYVPRCRDQSIEVLLGHALHDDLLISKPVLKEIRHIKRDRAVHLLERGFSIDETRIRTNVSIELRFVDQISDGLDVRIAALPEITAQHVFGLSGIGRRSQAPDRRPRRDERWIKEHVHEARDLVIRKGIRKLLDEDLVAIQRSVLVDAALKQRSSRTWIDNRGAQPAKIANRALCDVDAFGIGIVEEFLIQVLSDNA